MKDFLNINPQKAVLITPIIFILHVLEEFPSLVCWMNTLTDAGISQSFFITVNGFGLVITVFLSWMMYRISEGIMVILNIIWISFFMFANAIFHITASIVYHIYSPGMITSVIFYFPFFCWFLLLVMKIYKIRFGLILLPVILGSIPMLVHGYFILFEGRIIIF